MCVLAGVSRCADYPGWGEGAPAREERSLRDAIQRLALAHRNYGYRGITILLKRQGWAVNRKRVARLMRDDNLLRLRKTPFKPATTSSQRDSRVWPNVARRLIPMATNQLWVANIAYVRLDEAFVYLAVILDAFSRKLVGWAMEDHLKASLALEALQMALDGRVVIRGGLVHQSDRGVQNCLWRLHRPESFMKTLKTEEVDASADRDLAHARSTIGTFIEDVYNRQRLHSALA
jgi:transposase InsO family protein